MKKKLLIIGGIALVVIIAIVLVICLTGGRGGNNAMVGTWGVYRGANASEEYNFRADGTYTYTVEIYGEKTSIDGSYSYKNNTLTIGGTECTVKDNSFTYCAVTYVKK